MSSTLVRPAELDLRALMALPESEWPDVSHLVTEDDEPVDSLIQAILPKMLVDSLECSWHPGVPFVALANVGVFDHVGPAVAVPDMLLAMNVKVHQDQENKQNRSYFIWVFGKPPDVVVGIVSNKVGGEGPAKSKKYAAMGVSYYVVFDPFHYINQDLLIVYELQGDRYRRRKDCQLPGVQLQAVIWEGEMGGIHRQWLRWTTPDGTLLLRGKELAEQERQRAGQERQRAEQERQRAEKAEQRAKLLEEKLRALGIDTNNT